MSGEKFFLFNKFNYYIFLISLSIIIIGFTLMIGGGGDNEYDFNPEIFSKTRIIVSPILIIIGYLGLGLSIFYDRGN